MCLIVLSMILLRSLTLVAAAQPAALPQPSAAADPPLRPLADWAAALLTPTPTTADGPLTAPRMSQRDGEQGSSWQSRSVWAALTPPVCVAATLRRVLIALQPNRRSVEVACRNGRRVRRCWKVRALQQ